MSITDIFAKLDNLGTEGRCGHCKELQSGHTDGLQCLFAPTQYREMTDAELYEYRRPMRELAAVGAAVISDALARPSFLRSIFPAVPAKKEEP